MSLHQSAWFLRAYHLFPHRLLNQLCARLMVAEQPAFAVQAAIRLWIRRSRIDMSDFVAEPHRTLESFFLRRLRPGARPLSAGLCSPVDGEVFAAGTVRAGATLLVKGQRLSLERLVNGRSHHAQLCAYEGGHYLAIFLSPRGYHHIHMPVTGRLRGCQWIPGRYFPQNAVALQHIPAVYERNERLALFCAAADATPFLMILVGASLVGGIHLADLPRPRWATARPTTVELPYEKGQRLAHFSFGSTVVLLFPPGYLAELQVGVGDAVRMGQALAWLKER